MSLPLWCLFAAAVLVVLSKGPVILILRRTNDRYDNQHPRMQQAALTGPSARALAAHQNTIEAFPLFAAGVIVAQMFAPNSVIAVIVSLLFIVARLLYVFLYIANQASLRSVVWAVGYFASLILMLAPLYPNF